MKKLGWDSAKLFREVSRWGGGGGWCSEDKMGELDRPSTHL